MVEVSEKSVVQRKTKIKGWKLSQEKSKKKTGDVAGQHNFVYNTNIQNFVVIPAYQTVRLTMIAGSLKFSEHGQLLVNKYLSSYPLFKVRILKYSPKCSIGFSILYDTTQANSFEIIAKSFRLPRLFHVLQSGHIGTENFHSLFSFAVIDSIN